MREIVFRVLSEQPGLLEARADDPVLTITAPSREELHHEAREALIQHFGHAHASWRVRIRSGAALEAGSRSSRRLGCKPQPIGCG
ncbi:hypothetical protein CPCC7001_2714 [Cyanobium sp. PCC 7001]|uniref:hypothetical protein n=1 Tax=Cyanobium sp. PCC 7001 TaxID=180281 RepID=UPI000180514D|nr:hypothetical protein [Cyanobium sp. PCC 7001]EDY39833.1 hypothetical protein CPCC7001_2714 [Cyanobium sp. PCC 7001]